MLKKKSGFTLVELLVVIAIISILSVIGIVVFTGIQKGARDSKRKADLNAIYKAFEVKYNATGSYGDLAPADNNYLFSSGFPKDPSGEDYTIIKNNGSGGFMICTALEPNPQRVCSTPSSTCMCRGSSQADPPSTQSSFIPITNTDTVAATCGNSTSQGLVGFWKMDDGSGNTALDSTGSGKNGTLVNNPSWVAGLIGDALSFNGSNSVRLPNTGSNFPTNQFTVTFWVQPNSTSGNQFIWIYGRSGGSGRVGVSKNGAQWQAYAYWGPPATIRGGTATAGQWTFVTFIKNTPNDQLYVNGSLVASGNLNATTPPINAGGGNLIHDLGIGDNGNWNGLIDEVRFYNTVLSSSTITSLYGNGIGCI